MRSISKSPILLAIGTLMIVSCATPNKTKIVEYSVSPKVGSESALSVVVTPTIGREDGFCFTLTNTGSEILNVDWDHSYLLINNHTYRCIHAGIRFMEKAAPQATTPIAPGSKISDCLFPEENVEMGDAFTGWIQKPLGSNTGEYYIALISNGKNANAQGAYTMEVKDSYVSNSQTQNASTMSFITGLYLVTGIIGLIGMLMIL